MSGRKQCSLSLSLLLVSHTGKLLCICWQLTHSLDGSRKNTHECTEPYRLFSGRSVKTFNIQLASAFIYTESIHRGCMYTYRFCCCFFGQQHQQQKTPERFDIIYSSLPIHWQTKDCVCFEQHPSVQSMCFCSKQVVDFPLTKNNVSTNRSMAHQGAKTHKHTKHTRVSLNMLYAQMDNLKGENFALHLHATRFVVFLSLAFVHSVCCIPFSFHLFTHFT